MFSLRNKSLFILVITLFLSFSNLASAQFDNTDPFEGCGTWNMDRNVSPEMLCVAYGSYDEFINPYTACPNNANLCCPSEAIPSGCGISDSDSEVEEDTGVYEESSQNCGVWSADAGSGGSICLDSSSKVILNAQSCSGRTGECCRNEACPACWQFSSSTAASCVRCTDSPTSQTFDTEEECWNALPVNNSPVPENISCGWTPLDNPESPYHGRPAFCISGFSTIQGLQSSDAIFDCKNNCGGIKSYLEARLTGWDGQHVSLNNSIAGLDDNGLYYTCMTGDFDGSIKATISDCLRDKGIATVTTGIAGGGAGAIIGSLIPIPGSTVFGLTITGAGGAGIGNSVFNCAPTISGKVEMADGFNSCEANLRVEINLDTEAGNLEIDNDVYSICESNLDPNGIAYQNCDECMDNEGIWTSIGCIEKDPKDLISKLITIGTGILGGVFLLRVLSAAFLLTTSQGDVKKTSEAKEMITEAIIGVLFIIFSVTILQFIGSDVMKIPGFGS
ncbi:MAG: hypothetical protein GW942_01390 [Candidatus Pacebacteria bacterium]|nr:hypothetical protein [Candidatus Paceibacterota bacterium]